MKIIISTYVITELFFLVIIYRKNLSLCILMDYKISYVILI